MTKNPFISIGFLKFKKARRYGLKSFNGAATVN